MFTELSDDADHRDAPPSALADGKAVGWFQGRMEFGPRALGARSILGDARSPDDAAQLNLKVKFREIFRPFAPSVLREDVADWFELDGDSPYMLLVADVVEHAAARDDAEREQLCSGSTSSMCPRSRDSRGDARRLFGAHPDRAPRNQPALSRAAQPRSRAVTGCPVLVNTSFNVRGEPIVCTPEDAFRCFMGTEIDVLVVGNFFLRKEDQDPALRLDYRDRFDPD